MSEEPLHLYYPLSLPRDIDTKLLLRVDSHMPDILDRLSELCGTGKTLAEATDELAVADFLHVNNPDLYRYKVRELLLAVFRWHKPISQRRAPRPRWNNHAFFSLPAKGTWRSSPTPLRHMMKYKTVTMADMSRRSTIPSYNLQP